MSTNLPTVLSNKQGWVFVVGVVGFMLVGAVCFICLTLNRMSGNDKLVQAQVKVYEAQAENVGKPTIIRQEYVTPMKAK